MSTLRESTSCLLKQQSGMHASTQRLLDFARAQTARTSTPVRTFAELRKRLNVSSATMSNWKTRGVSQEGAIEAEKLFGCPANWILDGGSEPIFTTNYDGLEDAAFKEVGMTAESTSSNLVKTHGSWPLDLVDQSRYEALDERSKAFVQGKMMSAIEQLEDASRKRQAHG